MLKKLLTELMLQDEEFKLLFGSRDAGEEGQLKRFIPKKNVRQQNLGEASLECQKDGLYEKAIHI